MIKKGDESKTNLTSSNAGGQKPVIKEGDSVVLHGGDQRILVRNVKLLGPGKYRGVIYGFSPSFKHEHRGLKVGESLEFRDEDIVDRPTP